MVAALRRSCKAAAHRRSSGKEVFALAAMHSFRITALIDPGDLAHPAQTLLVFQIENRLHRPMEVVRDEGYLLVQRPEGVAYNPPSA